MEHPAYKTQAKALLLARISAGRLGRLVVIIENRRSNRVRGSNPGVREFSRRVSFSLASVAGLGGKR